jgi:hypothetical protein
MMHCPICVADVQPAIDINAQGQAVACCPKCQAPLGAGIAATDQPAPEPGPREETDAEFRQRMVHGDPSSLPGARLKGGRMAAPTDLVAAAKERLVVIDTELERLDQLQRERRRLAAMIAAAESADLEDDLALAVRRVQAEPNPPAAAGTPLLGLTFAAAE